MNARTPGDAGALDKDDGSLRNAVARTYQRLRLPLQRWLVRSMLRREDAEDALQDVFERYAAADKHLPADEQEPYLRTVTRHAAHDAWQQAARRDRAGIVSLEEHMEAAEQIAGDESADPANRVEHRQRLTRLEEALSELPERRREAFVLYSIDGLTQTEVAARMGISRRMVHNHVTLAYAYCGLRVQYRSAQDMKIAQALEADKTP